MQTTTIKQLPANGASNSGRDTISKIRLNQVSAWLHLSNEFIIEVQGDILSLVRFGPSRSSRSAVKHSVVQFDVKLIRNELRLLGYRGQPTPIVLHPAAVCVKTYKIGEQSPSKWIAGHLDELSPIGNRSDLILTYNRAQPGWLMLALVRRSFLLRLRDTLWAAGVSIKGIWPAAVISAEFSAEGAKFTAGSNWILQNYVCLTDNGEFSVVPQGRSAGVQAVPALPESDLNDLLVRLGKPNGLQDIAAGDISRFDFAPQIKLPRTYPTDWIVRSSKFAAITFVALCILALLHLGARSIYEHSYSQDMSAIDYKAEELASLRAENSIRKSRLSSLQQLDSRHSSAALFLASLKDGVPGQTWLSSIRLRLDDSRHQYDFAISGYAYAEGEPAQFAGILATKAGFESVVLTKTALTEEVPKTQSANSSNRLTRFELSGRLSR